MDSEEITYLREILETHRKQLRKLQLQEAKFGNHCPTYILLNIDEVKIKIKEIEGEIKKLTEYSSNEDSFTIIEYDQKRTIKNTYNDTRGLHKQKGYIHPCILNRRSLVKLIRTIEEQHLPHRQRILNISTDSFESSSIEELLRSPLPDEFSNLNIEYKELRGNNLRRYISLTLTNTYIWLYIRGVDKDWVRWKFKQITELLRENKPWFWLLRHKSSQPNRLSGLLNFVTAVSAIIVTSSVASHRNKYLPILFLLSIIIAVISSLYYKGLIFPCSRILLGPKKGLTGQETAQVILSVTIFLTFMMLAFSVLFLYMEE